MARTWPSGPPTASDIDFRANFSKATLITNRKRMFGVQAGPSRTSWGPGMAQTWPSGPSPAPDIDFRANFTSATLIPNKKRMFGDPSGPPRTTWGQEMAKTWPSGPSPAPYIDFRANFTTAILIPNKNGCLEFSLDHLGQRGARKWPKLGHLDHLQPQTSILGQISLKKHRFVNKKRMLGVQFGPCGDRKCPKLDRLDHP